MTTMLAQKLSRLPIETVLLCLAPRCPAAPLLFRRTLVDAATDHAPARMRYYADMSKPLAFAAAREALYNWLHAQKTGGQLFFRINDLQVRIYKLPG
jgi:hypothetical protein